MGDGTYYGNLKMLSVCTIADRAARSLQGYRSPRAVGIEPDGRVYSDAIDNIPESDLVGVYESALGLLELSRRLNEDLRFEVGARGLRAKAAA